MLGDWHRLELPILRPFSRWAMEGLTLNRKKSRSRVFQLCASTAWVTMTILSWGIPKIEWFFEKAHGSIPIPLDLNRSQCVVSAKACVSAVACVNILGTSLGLRGPDGSVRQAADGMHQQTLDQEGLGGGRSCLSSSLNKKMCQNKVAAAKKALATTVLN